MDKKELSIFIFAILVTGFYLIFYQLNLTMASTNIDAINRWTWNDVSNWIDFYSTNTVTVYGTRLEGYASSSIGYIAFNCASTPNGNICGGSAGNWKVSNDGNGNLTGWAWNDGIGWISFDSGSANSAYSYQVIINPSTGEFSGWAWNDIIGWISFNCLNTGTCGTVNYKVVTSWNNHPIVGYLYSSIFDTQSVGGASINSIMWKGIQPSGTLVKFQIASSNSSEGPWNYIGPAGTSADTDIYTGPADTTILINLAHHNNKKYVRYKVYLDSDSSQSQTPQVEDIIINWGP